MRPRQPLRLRCPLGSLSCSWVLVPRCQVRWHADVHPRRQLAGGRRLATRWDAGAKVTFRDAYVASRARVSSGSSAAVLDVDAGGVVLPFAIHHAVITFRQAAGRATGIIAGVLATEEVVGRCDRSGKEVAVAVQRLGDRVDRADDSPSLGHHLDGTNAASTPCDAFSIGLGFEAHQIGPLTRVVADPSAPPKSCP
jgi:hypothetical protein